MTRVHVQLLALACALLVLAAATTTAAAPPPPSGSAVPAKTKRAGGTASKKKSSSATQTEVVASSPRRLEDVRIEGELEVPRITFITVRQPHRFADYTRATSVRSSRRMAAETALPAWIPPSRNTSQEARKESPK